MHHHKIPLLFLKWNMHFLLIEKVAFRNFISFHQNIFKIQWILFLSYFFKWKKTIVFGHKFVQNHYIVQNLAKFSPKSTKTANLSLKTAISKIYLLYQRKRIWHQTSAHYVQWNPKNLGVFLDSINTHHLRTKSKNISVPAIGAGEAEPISFN